MIEEILSLKDDLTGPARGMQNALSSIEDGLASAFKSATGMQGGVNGVSGALDAVIPGLGEAVGAVMALGAAFGGLVLAGASLALEQSQLKNQMLATFSALAGGAEAGQATLDMVNDLSGALPQSREQLAGWTKQFQAMGVTDLGALRNQITATASAQALMGDTGAAAYTGLSKKIQEAILAHQGLKVSDRQLQTLASTGVNVADVAAQMGVSTQQLRSQLAAGTVDAGKFGDAMQNALINKGQGPLATMGASMSVQLAKLKENFGRLFEDVNPGPFLDGLKDLLNVFSQSTASGQALKFMVTGFFNGLFSIASKVFPYIKKFFLELVIVGLKFYIALKPTIAAFKSLFATKGDGDSFSGMVVGIADAIGVVLQGVATAVGWFAKLLTIGKDVVSGLSDAFSGIGTIASQMIDGLISGITGGVSRAVEAAKGLAQSALDGIKGVLGIHSPSTVMMALGGHTATGFSQGLNADTSVASAASDMGGGVALNAAAYSGGGAGQSAGGKGGGGNVSSGGNTYNIDVQISGAGQSAQEITETMVATVFERLRLAEGL